MSLVSMVTTEHHNLQLPYLFSLFRHDALVFPVDNPIVLTIPTHLQNGTTIKRFVFPSSTVCSHHLGISRQGTDFLV